MLQFRIKDETTGKHLQKKGRAAFRWAVNFVWNYCNERIAARVIKTGAVPRRDASS